MGKKASVGGLGSVRGQGSFGWTVCFVFLGENQNPLRPEWIQVKLKRPR